MRKLLLKIMLCFCCLTLLGCQNQEVEDTMIPLGVGFDLKDGSIIATVELADPVAPENSTSRDIKPTITSASGTTIGEASRNLSLYLPKIPLWSHSNILILGEELCQTDMSLVVDYLSRNPSIRHNVLVLVASETSAQKILNVKPFFEPYISMLLIGSIENQEKQIGIYEKVTLSTLLQKLNAPGVEPVLPQVKIIKQGEQEKAQLSGMSVFKREKSVGELTPYESQGFRFLGKKEISSGLIVISNPYDPRYYVTLELLNSHCNIKPVITDNNITMQINIVAEGNFYEQSGGENLLTLENYALIENQTNSEIANMISSCIDKAQLLNSDIFGWGQLLSEQESALWAQISPNWDAVFPVIKNQIQVTFKVRRSYLTRNSFVFRD